MKYYHVCRRCKAEIESNFKVITCFCGKKLDFDKHADTMNFVNSVLNEQPKETKNEITSKVKQRAGRTR